MDDSRFRDLLNQFLLSRLSGDEAAELEREIEQRGPSGEAELAALRATLAEVALSAPAVAPPASLRERILAAVETERGGDASSVLLLKAPPRSSTAPWMAAALVAASLALLLAFWNVRLRDGLQDARQRVAADAARLARADSLERELADARRDLAALAAPSGSALSLVGTEKRPDARARIFIDPATSRAILFVYELPILQPGSVYELWAIRDGSPSAAGTFVTNPDGRARIELDPAAIRGAEVLAVTVEPAPGGLAPTGPMVLTSPSS